MSLQIKAKILEVAYDKENNLFRLLLEDVSNDKKTQIAIKGSDWGVTSSIPDNIIKEFCDNMRGKEKNIHIEKEESSLRDAKRDDKGAITQEEINKTYKNLDNFPIDEVMNVLDKESGTNAS